MQWVRFLMVGAAAIVWILSAPQGLRAAERIFPSKPIQVIIPFQPGQTDNLLRPWIEKMPEFLGQPLTLVYKPGAAGSVGAGIVAASKPDGYTLVGSSQSSITVLPLDRTDLGYTWESFTPVCCLTNSHTLFVVKSESPWKTIQDFVAEAKKSPGRLTYSTSGTYGADHLTVEAFSKQAGIKLNFIPSQGSAAAMTAMLGGHVNMAVAGIAPASPHIKTGSLRAIVTMAETRARALPEVPTLTESGYQIGVLGRYGLLAPRGTPPEVVEAIYNAARKVVENHRAYLLDRLDKLESEIGLEGHEGYRVWLKSQNDFFGRLLQEVKKEMKR